MLRSRFLTNSELLCVWPPQKKMPRVAKGKKAAHAPSAPKPAKPRQRRERKSTRERKSSSSAPPGKISLAVERIFKRRRSKSDENSRLSLWRSATREQRLAWFQRPAGCLTLEEAVQIYRERVAFEAIKENSFLRVPQHKKLSQYPEWCYSHEHPLKTGRRRTLYYRSDFVTPIVESMTETLTSKYVDVFGVASLISKERKQKNKKKFVTFAIDANASTQTKESSVDTKEGYVEHPFTCFECGTHDVGKLSDTSEGQVCTCGAVHGRNIVSVHRQKLGMAEEEDKTVVADQVFAARQDKYDSGPESTQDARQKRMLLGKFGSSIPGSRNALGLGRMCDAQRVCSSMAAKDAVDTNVHLGLSLQPRDCIKQRAVLRELEELFKIASPISNPIKRMVRIQTDRLYVKSVQHSYHCKNMATCDARLSDRHATSIALSCFHFEIDRLVELAAAEDVQGHAGSSSYSDDLRNIDTSHLKNVQSKLKRSSMMQQMMPNNQLLSVKQTILRLVGEGFDLKAECQPLQTVDADPLAAGSNKRGQQDDFESVMPSNLMSSAPSLTNVKPVTMASLGSLGSSISRMVQESPSISSVGRTKSLSSQGELSPGVQPYVLGLRDAIHDVFSMHKSELMKTSSRSSAIKLIQEQAFEEFVSGSSTLAELDPPQLAFCLLSALDTSERQRLTFNAGIAERLSIPKETCSSAMDTILSFVEKDGSARASTLVNRQTSDTSLFD